MYKTLYRDIKVGVRGNYTLIRICMIHSYLYDYVHVCWHHLTITNGHSLTRIVSHTKNAMILVWDTTLVPIGRKMGPSIFYINQNCLLKLTLVLI